MEKAANANLVPANREVRILLVEDNSTNQEVASVLLTSQGFQVDTVENGQQALATLQRNRYHLVLMDCLMPVMDGFEATRRLRRGDPPTLSPRIPVIAVTACATPEDRARCREAGMDDYVSKPIMESELFAAIARALDRNAQAQPASNLNRGSEAPPVSSPVFDAGEMLQRLAGNRSIAVVMLRRLLSDMPVRLNELQAALSGGQANTACREAHTIKGLAAGAGARQLWQAARRAERLCQEDLLDQAAQELPEITDQVNRILPEWEAFLAANE
jgi:CheY-like chemotaxis protein/HPt (histidine-containing phosphotransfer) domain-containing protein